MSYEPVTDAELDRLCAVCGERYGRHASGTDLCPGSTRFVPLSRPAESYDVLPNHRCSICGVEWRSDRPHVCGAAQPSEGDDE